MVGREKAASLSGIRARQFHWDVSERQNVCRQQTTPGGCAVFVQQAARGASNGALSSSGVVRANKNLGGLTNNLFIASYLASIYSICVKLFQLPAERRQEPTFRYGKSLNKTC